ncbi:MAG: glycosyltransferase family 4 protein [Actinomycetota bacterium]|nr:glycosyltransferase family 4 protein [Actinomycetota bacterium]
MNILLLTEFFPETEAAEITGGVEGRCYYVARHLRRRHDVKVIATPTDGTQWDHASFVSIPRRLTFLARAFIQGMRFDFDLVEGSNFVVHPMAWLLGTLRRKPVVLYYPDVLLGQWIKRCGPVGALGALVERAILKLPVARYITTSPTVVERMVAAGVDHEKISLIPCGFEDSLVTSVRREADQAFDDQPLYDIVVVNRLVGYKRVDVVVRAVAQLARTVPAIRALVVGRGPELDALNRLASELDVRKNIEFTGHVREHADVLRLVARSRIFVSASEVEGFGIALVEAMALGLPYVVSDIPVVREVTGGGTGGFLFAPGDQNELAAKLGALLDDEELQRRKGDEGLSFSGRYTWRKVSTRTEQVYEGLLQEV